MKENLKKSLSLLSKSLDDLFFKLEKYKSDSVNKNLNEINFYKVKAEKAYTDLNNLKHNLVIEQNKNSRVMSEIKDLTVFLKNNLD